MHLFSVFANVASIFVFVLRGFFIFIFLAHQAIAQKGRGGREVSEKKKEIAIIICN